MEEQIIKDAEKYAFAHCLVYKTTSTLLPLWNFQRQVNYTPRFTPSILKFTLMSHRLRLHSTYLPSAEKVGKKYKKVLQPIVRYQTAIGYDALELLVFGTFLGLYCARLLAAGIEEAPDFAVIAIANALKFFDDTDQFEDDGWTRLDACALRLCSTAETAANAEVSASKMGERIEQFLSGYVTVPPPVSLMNISKTKAVSYITTGAKRRNTTTELQMKNPQPPPYAEWLQKYQPLYTTANFKVPNTVSGEASATVGRHVIPQMLAFQDKRIDPLLYYCLLKK